MAKRETRPLSWHKECLINSEYSLETCRLAMLRAIDDYSTSKAHVADLKNAIADAEKRGKTELPI